MTNLIQLTLLIAPWFMGSPSGGHNEPPAHASAHASGLLQNQEPASDRFEAAMKGLVSKDSRFAVGVVLEGEVLFEIGRGNPRTSQKKRFKPISPAHIFDLGSVSKSVTAAAVLHLVTAKGLSLNAPLTDFFHDLPEQAQGVTLKQLLGHTSSLPKSISLTESADGDGPRAVREIMKQRRSGAPGEEFHYSNVGYQVLAAWVEEVSGERFESYVEKKLFKRARLPSARLVGGTKPKKESSTQRISGKMQSKIELFPYGFGRKGTTGALMSVRDFIRWDEALRKGKVLDDASRELWAEEGLGGYGLGWFVRDDGPNGKRLQHGGNVEGYQSWVARWPSKGALIVVLGDENLDKDAIGQQLERALFPKEAGATDD